MFMRNERFDVIVIGAGVGGPTAGAILAKKEGMKVLVLEKASRVGGRDISFRLQDEDPETYRKAINDSAHTWYVKSEPGLQELFRQGLLDGYSFEAGIHTLMVTEKGRTNTCLSYLGKPLTLYPAISAGWWHGGKLYRFENGSERGGNFPWMDEKGRAETGKINSLMVRMSAQEAHSYDHISLKEWMEARTDNNNTKEFHYVNATMNCTINDPANISAGDNILMNRAVARAGKRFSFGGCSTPGLPGFVQIPLSFCDVIKENGGRVVTRARVKEVLIEAGRVKGVLVDMEGGEEKIDCPVVINSGLVNEMFQYIPEKHFPYTFVKRVKGFWSAGIGAVYFGLDRKIVQEHLTFIPKIAGREHGFDSDVRMGFWDSSGMDPQRAPAGKQLVDAYVSLTDKEAHNPELVNLAYDRMLAFMTEHYPGFKEALSWTLYTVSDSLVPVAQAPFQVGDARPRAKSPHVKGLYLASDSSECSMAANDAAVHAGIIAASRVSNRDYVSEILPEYSRY
ncbi:MAG: FAD-dependent oxidoreductase [Deltaproteobacteria bacterium]|nr:FAD-dependent oxidoreductase [Deltaproteobacteria bacterium]